MVGVDQVVGGIGEESRTFVRAGPLGRRIGGEMNFGVTSDAAPNAASSSVARYSCLSRFAVS